MRLERGHVWRGIGYGLTAAWMIVILVITDSDPSHPWFDYIFVVPLVGWIITVGIARFATSRNGPPVPPIDASKSKRRDTDDGR